MWKGIHVRESIKRGAIIHSFTIFGGSANPRLAESVGRELGIVLGASEVERFPDGEVSVHLLEPVRRKNIFILQPTSPPVDEHLIELLSFADAARRSAAERVTAVIPYFGYARSDKRHARREPITARMVGDLLQAVNVQHVLTFDLHAPQIEGFFRIPVDNLTAVPLLADALASHVPERAVVVAPDSGRVRMATQYAERLGLPLVVLHKRRESGSKTAVTRIVGEVRDCSCVLIDDMIATGGTIATSVETLLNAGARPDIRVVATHGLLLDGARETLEREGVREVMVTDTIQVEPAGWSRLRVESVAPLIAGAIGRLMADGSFQDLYQ